MIFIYILYLCSYMKQKNEERNRSHEQTYLSGVRIGRHIESDPYSSELIGKWPNRFPGKPPFIARLRV